MPFAHSEHWGDWGCPAKCPGGHIWQASASTSRGFVAQPAGQMLHQGSREGGRGQPAPVQNAFLKFLCSAFLSEFFEKADEISCGVCKRVRSGPDVLKGGLLQVDACACGVSKILILQASPAGLAVHVQEAMMQYPFGMKMPVKPVEAVLLQLRASACLAGFAPQLNSVSIRLQSAGMLHWQS